MTYRVGGHWAVTIIREGELEPDGAGRRPDDDLVMVVVNGDQLLAQKVVDALNAAEVQ